MTHTDELLPCPFCGGEAAAYEGQHCSSVKCDNGHAIHEYKPTLAEAITAWNTRTLNPDAVADVVAALEAINNYDGPRKLAASDMRQFARTALARIRGEG